jgi:Fe-S cluster assembly ATP-binding protein
MLEIKDLHVEIDGKEMIKGVSLTFYQSKVHVIMGPNGSGKSTLANAIMGHPRYKITQGKIILNGKDITKEKTNVRAKLGLFLSFQHPQEIPGITINNFLRTAVNSVKNRQYSVMEFYALLKNKMVELNMDPAFSNRYLNEGFSGGEKKKTEILQMAMLEPKYALLDETDSGTDVDAIKIIAKAVNKLKSKSGIIVITHYNRFLKYIHPDKISILYQGKIIKQGDFKLAKQIENEGFEKTINGN